MNLLKEFLLKNKKSYSADYSSRGFTLLELLLVVAIITILSATIVPISQTVFTQSNLSISAHNLESDLYKAYTYAREGKEDSSWAVLIKHSSEGSFVYLHTDSSTEDSYEIPSSVIISGTLDDPGVLSNDSVKNVSFEEGTGIPNIPNDIDTIILTSEQGISDTITINKMGQISFYNNTYNLIYGAGDGGTVTGNLSQMVMYNGSGTTVTAVPDAGHYFTSWSDGSTQNPRTDTNVIGNISVVANFTIEQHTLNYLAGPHGSITGTNSQTVNYGGSGSAVTAVPNSGFSFINWSDGSTQNPRTDTNVQSNINVTANFDRQYNLTYIAGSYGSITGTTSQTVLVGNNGTAVTAVPNSGYAFVNWSDGSTQNPRIDTNVQNNISVTANFSDWVSVLKIPALYYFTGSYRYVENCDSDMCKIIFDDNDIPYMIKVDTNNGYKATVLKSNGTSWVGVGNSVISQARASYVSIAFDSNNVLYAEYMDNTQTVVEKFNGTSWINVGNISGISSNTTGWPIFKISAGNILYFADGSYYGGSSGKLSVLKFDGSVWVSVGMPGFSIGKASPDSFVFDSNNTPYVAYNDYYLGTIQEIIKKFDGSNWVIVGPVGAPTKLYIDSSDVLYGVYAGTVKQFDGSSWVNIGSSGTFGTALPVLSFDSNNTLYATYADAGNSNKTTMKKFNGTNWVTVGMPGFSDGPVYKESYYPDSIFPVKNLNDVPHAAFISTSGGNSYFNVMYHLQ